MKIQKMRESEREFVLTTLYEEFDGLVSIEKIEKALSSLGIIKQEELLSGIKT